MKNIMPYVDVVIANKADAADMLDIQADKTNVEHGELDVARYPDVARQIAAEYPNVSRVAITLRQSISASHNRWGAMLYDVASDHALFAPQHQGVYQPYEITHIVDRVGTGDAFGAALIYASLDPDLRDDALQVLGFAVAASTLCHSIEGDINYVSRAEIEALARGNASGRIVR